MISLEWAMWYCTACHPPAETPETEIWSGAMTIPSRCLIVPRLSGAAAAAAAADRNARPTAPLRAHPGPPRRLDIRIRLSVDDDKRPAPD